MLFATNIVLGVLTTVAFVLLGMEDAAVWGLATAVLHFVPYLGSVVIAVTSGKGGVGKTFVSANVAAALAKRGLRVLVLDADLGLANLDVVLNLYPKITLHDVFTGKAKLEDAVIQAPGGFSVLLAGSGMVEYSRLTPELRARLQVLHSTDMAVIVSSAQNEIAHMKALGLDIEPPDGVLGAGIDAERKSGVGLTTGEVGPPSDDDCREPYGGQSLIAV